jgi:hypothetical protein
MKRGPKIYVPANCGSVAIPAGYQEYGAWTALWTIPFDLDGILFQVIATGTNQAINMALGPSGSSAPSGANFVNDLITANFYLDIMPPVFPVYTRLPGGSILYCQTGANGNEANLSLNVWGIPRGCIENSRSEILVTSAPFSWTLAGNVMMTSIPINSTVQMTPSPVPFRVKRVNLLVNAYEPYDLVIGYGPSTTMTETLIGPLHWSSNSTGQMAFDFECDIYPNMNLFVQNINTTSSANPKVAFSYAV